MTLFEIIITKNKQTNKQIYCKGKFFFIVMTIMITSAKMTLFEKMITNEQTNKKNKKKKQTNK